MAMFWICKLIFGLVLVQQIVAEFTSTDGWQQVTRFHESTIDGAPKLNGTIYEISPNYKTGEEVVMNTTSATGGIRSCAQFEYYVNTPHNYGLKVVHLERPSGRKHVLWSRYGFSGDVWRTATIPLIMAANDLLQFVGTTTSGAIAMSYLRFDTFMTHCWNMDWNTDFETDGNTGWNSRNVVVGQLYEGFKDHTSGSEMGKVAYLTEGEISPKLKIPNNAKCFTFWFNRPKSKLSLLPLKVFINGAAVWDTNDERDHSSDWHRVQIPLNYVQDVNSLAIKAFPMPNENGSAALFDDFELSGENCAAPVDCSFNGSICGWTDNVLEKHDHTWTLGEGRVRSADTFQRDIVPILKNTIYTDFTQNRPQRGIEIKSDILPDDGEHCLVVHYHHKNITKGDIFNVEHLVPSNDKYQSNILWAMNALLFSEMANVLHERTIEVEVPAYNKPRRVGLYVRSSNEGTRIAVKDVTLRNGRCKPLPTTVGPTPAPSKLDKNTLVLAAEFMKNSRDNVKRIVELITIDDPVKTSAMKTLAEMEAAIVQIEQNIK